MTQQLLVHYHFRCLIRNRQTSCLTHHRSLLPLRLISSFISCCFQCLIPSCCQAAPSCHRLRHHQLQRSHPGPTLIASQWAAILLHHSFFIDWLRFAEQLAWSSKLLRCSSHIPNWHRTFIATSGYWDSSFSKHITVIVLSIADLAVTTMQLIFIGLLAVSSKA